jgi:hypothetical protein
MLAMMKSGYWCLWCLLFGAASIRSATSRDLDEARLLRLVPWQIDALARSAPDCHPPGVRFIGADFDGNGSFRYVIASYFAVCGNRVSSAVRVLKEKDGKFLLHQVPSGVSFRAGQILSPGLVDLENSGVPELLFRVWQGADTTKNYSLLLFRWRDETLQPISTEQIDTRQAVFRDLDVDGRLELVTFPHCPTSSRQKKDRVSASGTYQRAASVAKLCPDRRIYLYRSGEFTEIKVKRSEAELTRVVAAETEFSLEEIHHQPGTLPTQKEFVVQLEWSDPNDPVSATKIKPETLLLGRALRPLAVTTKLEQQVGDCTGHGSHSVQCFQGEVLEARFDRKSVATLLPKLQLTKTLETGDVVAVPLTALMENGDYVSADIMVSVSK